ncbi:hypothetical protein ACET5Y_12665 [Aeromonas veronii]
MFKPNNVALMVAVMLGATTAYAATKSAPTEKVVGFKPVYQNTDGKDAVTGELQLGKDLTVDPEKLGYFDADGDKQDLPNVRYRWMAGNIELGDTRTITIPDNKALVGQSVVLEVTPVSETGDPFVGKTLVLTDLVKAGATGGDGNGKIIDGNAKPFVDGLQLAGTLKQGEELTATYRFDAKGGHPKDASTFAWGTLGNSVANVTNKTIDTSGTVPAYRIQPTDAGEVLELSLQAKNGTGVTGNTITVDTTGKVTDIGGGTGGTGGGGGGKFVDPDGNGKVPYIKADPVKVVITFDSTATDELNGIDGIRPVAAVDRLSAEIERAPGASPYLDDYMFRWLADDQPVDPANLGTQGGSDFTPQAEHQGKIITVEVEPVK